MLIPDSICGKCRRGYIKTVNSSKKKTSYLVKAVCARKFRNSTLPDYVGIQPDVHFRVLYHVERLTVDGKK